MRFQDVTFLSFGGFLLPPESYILQLQGFLPPGRQAYSAAERKRAILYWAGLIEACMKLYERLKTL